MTERKFTNCFLKRIQKVFAFKCYVNCINSYLSIQTRLSFSAALVVWDIRKNKFNLPLLPFHITGILVFLCILVTPFIHPTYLRNQVSSIRVKTQDSYLGAYKGRISSLILVFSKTSFGPLVAASIVLLPAVWALVFIGVICCVNLVAELKTTYIIHAQKYLAVSSSIGYLLYHLSICVISTSVFKGKSEWTAGYVSIGFFALIIASRIIEVIVVIVGGLCKKKSSEVQPKKDSGLIKFIKS